ncbi:MAG: phytase [Bacteroidota bacterium]
MKYLLLPSSTHTKEIKASPNRISSLLSRLSILIVYSGFIGLLSCNLPQKNTAPIGPAVFATLETSPVQSKGDAADDPAIWLHPSNPQRSLIFGSDKQAGVYAFSMRGKQAAYYPIGEINNIDIRYDFPLPKGPVDILAGSNRSVNGLVVYSIDRKNGLLRNLTPEPFLSDLPDVYGFCLYHSRTDSQYYAFVVSTTGAIEQWRIIPNIDGFAAGEIVRKFDMGSKTEGMVADDEQGFIFIAQEDSSIWRVPADPDQPADKFLVASISQNDQLKGDLEGVALYYAAEGKGFLLASSQGNNSYAVFEREAPYAYLGSFHIADSAAIDGAEDTDGIEVTNRPIGNFSQGVFVAQDGFNKGAGGKDLRQNFKLVPWEDMADLWGVNGLVDTAYQVFGR